jgi:hypothetical protein
MLRRRHDAPIQPQDPAVQSTNVGRRNVEQSARPQPARRVIQEPCWHSHVLQQLDHRDDIKVSGHKPRVALRLRRYRPPSPSTVLQDPLRHLDTVATPPSPLRNSQKSSFAVAHVQASAQSSETFPRTPPDARVSSWLSASRRTRLAHSSGCTDPPSQRVLAKAGEIQLRSADIQITYANSSRLALAIQQHPCMPDTRPARQALIDVSSRAASSSATANQLPSTRRTNDDLARPNHRRPCKRLGNAIAEDVRSAGDRKDIDDSPENSRSFAKCLMGHDTVENGHSAPVIQLLAIFLRGTAST